MGREEGSGYGLELERTLTCSKSGSESNVQVFCRKKHYKNTR
jgi:hypothetical protein